MSLTGRRFHSRQTRTATASPTRPTTAHSSRTRARPTATATGSATPATRSTGPCRSSSSPTSRPPCVRSGSAKAPRTACAGRGIPGRLATVLGPQAHGLRQARCLHQRGHGAVGPQDLRGGCGGPDRRRPAGQDRARVSVTPRRRATYSGRARTDGSWGTPQPCATGCTSGVVETRPADGRLRLR